jgi:hypothetical protein
MTRRRDDASTIQHPGYEGDFDAPGGPNTLLDGTMPEEHCRTERSCSRERAPPEAPRDEVVVATYPRAPGPGSFLRRPNHEEPARVTLPSGRSVTAPSLPGSQQHSRSWPAIGVSRKARAVETTKFGWSYRSSVALQRMLHALLPQHDDLLEDNFEYEYHIDLARRSCSLVEGASEPWGIVGHSLILVANGILMPFWWCWQWWYHMDHPPPEHVAGKNQDAHYQQWDAGLQCL